MPEETPNIPGHYGDLMFRQVPDAITNIVRMAFSPCAVPWLLWVELGAAVALEAWWVVAEPDEKEAFHKIMGKSLVCSMKSEIRQAAKMAKTDEGIAKRLLFTSSEVVDELVWKLFLLNVVGHGLIKFSNLMTRMNKCQDHTNPNQGTGTGYVGALADDGTWQSMDYTFSAPSKYAPVSPSFIQIRPTHNGFCAASVKFHDSSLIPRGTNARLINETTGVIYDTDSAPPDGEGSNTAPKVFMKGRFTGAPLVTVSAQSQYVGPPMPFHEVFPDQLGMYCYLASPDP